FVLDLVRDMAVIADEGGAIGRREADRSAAARLLGLRRDRKGCQRQRGGEGKFLQQHDFSSRFPSAPADPELFVSSGTITALPRLSSPARSNSPNSSAIHGVAELF